VDSELTVWPPEDDFFADMRPSEFPLVYHYTTVPGMLSILERRLLWLSSAATMNDSAEGTWLQDHLLSREAQLSIERGAGRPLPEAESMRSVWVHVFGVYAPQAYVACFSQDGDMLSQWRAYASDGAGRSSHRV
jgi:hypothetical protein